MTPRPLAAWFKNGRASPDRGLLRPGFYRDAAGNICRDGDRTPVVRAMPPPAMTNVDAALRNAGYARPSRAGGDHDR